MTTPPMTRPSAGESVAPPGATLELSGKRRPVFTWRRDAPHPAERLTMPLKSKVVTRRERRRHALAPESATFCRAWNPHATTSANLERCLEEDWFFAGRLDRTYLIWLELHTRYIAPAGALPLLQAAARHARWSATFRALSYFFTVESDPWLQRAVAELTIGGSEKKRTRRAARRFREACREWGARHGGDHTFGDDLLTLWEAFGALSWLTGAAPRPPVTEEAFTLLTWWLAAAGRNPADPSHWKAFALDEDWVLKLATESAFRGWLSYTHAGGRTAMHPMRGEVNALLRLVLADEAAD